MASVRRGMVLGQIERIFGAGTSAGLPDAQLLERFLDRGDELAFATLVERHGRMVLGACRSVLRDPHDAEDAFQAVFLVLFRKAGSIRGSAAVGGWLHRVAIRIAIQANGAAARRSAEERRAGSLLQARTATDAVGDELRGALHAEIDRLPERYRAPVVLCHLEGLTRTEAAQRLRWSEGTVRGRLAKARQILRSRLTHRGVVCPAGLLSSGLAGEASAAVPEGWIAATVEAVSGASAPRLTAAILAGRVLKTILVAKLRLLAATFLAVGAIVCLGVVGPEFERTPPGAPGPEVQPVPAASATPPADSGVKINADTVSFAGRVLDPEGKPFAGAALYLIHPAAEGGEASPHSLAISGRDGRFRFIVTRAEVEEADGKHRRGQSRVVAVAEGLGPDWREAARAGADDLELRLVKDVPIEGHLLDLEGRPVSGARVDVREVASVKGGDLTPYIASVADGTEDGNGRLFDKRWDGRFPGAPESVRTDASGRFRLTGMGAERLVEIGVEGAAIESVTILAMTRVAKDVGGPGEKELGSGSGRVHGAAFDLLVRPGRMITGVVRDKATRQPIARMRVNMPDTSAHSVTGADGRFAIAGFGKGKKYRLVATALEGQPYFVTCIVVPDTVGLAPIEAEIACVPGIPFRLRLTDEVTGKAVIAGVSYWPLHPNPVAREVPGHYPDGIGALGYAHREADGSYVGAVLPGPGAIVIDANEEIYMPARVDPRPFFGEKVGPEAPAKGSERYGDGDGDYLLVAHGDDPARMQQSQFSAIVLTNAPVDSGPLSFDVALNRDTNRKVRVVDPAGRPLAGAVVMNRDGTETREGPFSLAIFTATGLNPKRDRRLTIRHDERRLAGLLILKGEETGPATVRLQPWGTITGRLVDAQGHPRANAAMEDAQQDPAGGRLWEPIKTDPDGRFRVEALVSGQSYSACLINVKDGGEYGFVFRDVALKPGHVLDLGDVRPTPPR